MSLGESASGLDVDSFPITSPEVKIKADRQAPRYRDGEYI